MISVGLFLCLLALAGAVRFHELIPDGATHFHRVPVEKYVFSWNRLMEIGHKLNGNTGSFVRFEDLEWDQKNSRANPFLFQGDIVLSEEQLDYLVESYEVELAKKEGRRFSRLFSTNNPTRLWDPSHFPIPWSINAEAPPEGGAAAIRVGLAVWAEKTCVSFEENGAGQHGHLQFYSDDGCFSSVGNDHGFNEISIGEGCDSPTTIDHEVGHSLGLFHVQNRNDADQYIDFLLQNVDANETDQFLPPTRIWMATNRGIPYDYGSAMQYDRFSFGMRHGLATMLPKDRNYNTTMGQDFEIAFTDAKEINMMYCNDVCPNKLPCLRGGYTDPKDCTKCRCPTGFAGTFCESVATGSARCAGNLYRATRAFQTLSANGTADCYFQITAPRGRKIELNLESANFQGEDWNFESCQEYFVEVKYSAQFQTARARFCPKSLAETMTMTSHSEEVLIRYKSNNDSYKFSLRYKYV